MNWGDLGKTLIGLGLPTIGGLLLGPAGAAVGKALADQIGAPATPEGLGKAIADPEVQKKLAETEAEWARTQAAIAQSNATQGSSVNTTMQAEIAAGVSWWHWRHLLGYVVGGWIAGIAVATTKLLFIGSADQITLLSPLLNSVWPYFGAACGLLGYVAMDTTRRTTAAAAGTPAGSIVDLIGGLLKRK
jgi:hypothetical protein